jgi:uncharacterized membrane-anchored protein
MNPDRELIGAAQSEGLLPAQATELLNEPAPSWVVTASSFIGAQFAVWPFLLFLGLLSGDVFFKPPVSLIASGAFIASAIVGLRRQSPMFITHLSFTALLLGLALLTFSMFPALRDYNQHGYNIALAMPLIVQIGAAMLVRVSWVQRILGLLSAFTFVSMIFITSIDAYKFDDWRSAVPQIANAALLALLWAAWCANEVRFSTQPLARSATAFFDGVAVALLITALLSSGSAFQFGFFGNGTRMGSADSEIAGTAQLFSVSWVSILQWVLTLGAWAWITRRWHLWAADKRRELLYLSLAYLCLMGFAFFTHDAGVVAVVGTVALATGRKRIFALALIVLLAQLSGFYYALAWPLVQKAAVLALVGAGLGAALFILQRLYGNEFKTAELEPHLPGSRFRFALPLIAISALAALGAANYDVMKKEQVITGGQKIYISLAPRDPRSLMQGDYMALNFGFAREIEDALIPIEGNFRRRRAPGQRSAQVVAKLDARGVATVLRVAQAQEPLANGEILLPLQYKKNNWVLVTDAFYFPEGMGEPFSKARFGEFRALADGRALLVGLADEQLAPIVAARRSAPQ